MKASLNWAKEKRSCYKDASSLIFFLGEGADVYRLHEIPFSKQISIVAS